MSNDTNNRETEELSSEATPLCPNCLKELNPKDYYCPHCNSPYAINPNATYMPFQQIRYENAPIARVFPIYGIIVLASLCFIWPLLSFIIVPLCIRWIRQNPRLQTRGNLVIAWILGILLLYVIVRKILEGAFFYPS